MSEVLHVAGAIAATGAVAAGLLLGDRRARAAALLAALAIGIALLAGIAWDEQLRDLRDEPGRLAAVVAASLAVVAVLLALFARLPWLLPLAILAALPFRIPVEAGGEEFNLLVPLYAVVAAGALSGALGLRRPGGFRSAGPLPVPRPLLLALAGFVVLYGLQTSYSADVTAAAETVAFFLVPFAVAFVVLAETRWTAGLLAAALAVIVGEAVIFAAIGIWQHEAETIFWNELLMESNDFKFNFRVNSLFWDPNIYARYLALAAIPLVALLMWVRQIRVAAAVVAILAVIWVGLAFAFSQTSLIALIAGLAVLAALRWSLRWTLAALGGLLASAVLFLAFFGDVVDFDPSSISLDHRTEGRATLVSGGVDLALDRPVLGHGSGSFSEAFRAANEVRPGEATVSHTEPITVAAEQGAVGLLAYGVLLAALLWTLFAGLGHRAPGLAGPPAQAVDRLGADGATVLVARVAIAAAFVALLVHTMGYAAFLTDPITWALLAIGGALASADLGADRPDATTTAVPAERPALAADGAEA